MHRHAHVSQKSLHQKLHRTGSVSALRDLVPQDEGGLSSQGCESKHEGDLALLTGCRTLPKVFQGQQPHRVPQSQQCYRAVVPRQRKTKNWGQANMRRNQGQQGRLNCTNPEPEFKLAMCSETVIRIPWKQSAFHSKQTDLSKVTVRPMTRSRTQTTAWLSVGPPT